MRRTGGTAVAEPGSIETDQHAPATWLDGTDPAGWADTAGLTDPFPPPLDLGVRPARGPWIDAGPVGRAEVAGEQPTDPPDALLADLAAADGDPDAGWTALHESDDPAVRALSLRWRPPA
jgi:hypothetical protein